MADRKELAKKYEDKSKRERQLASIMERCKDLESYKAIIIHNKKLTEGLNSVGEEKLAKKLSHYLEEDERRFREDAYFNEVIEKLNHGNLNDEFVAHFAENINEIIRHFWNLGDKDTARKLKDSKVIEKIRRYRLMVEFMKKFNERIDKQMESDQDAFWVAQWVFHHDTEWPDGKKVKAMWSKIPHIFAKTFADEAEGIMLQRFLDTNEGKSPRMQSEYFKRRLFDLENQGKKYHEEVEAAVQEIVRILLARRAELNKQTDKSRYKVERLIRWRLKKVGKEFKKIEQNIVVATAETVEAKHQIDELLVDFDNLEIGFNWVDKALEFGDIEIKKEQPDRSQLARVREGLKRVSDLVKEEIVKNNARAEHMERMLKHHPGAVKEIERDLEEI